MDLEWEIKEKEDFKKLLQTWNDGEHIYRLYEKRDADEIIGLHDYFVINKDFFLKEIPFLLRKIDPSGKSYPDFVLENDTKSMIVELSRVISEGQAQTQIIHDKDPKSVSHLIQLIPRGKYSKNELIALEKLHKDNPNTPLTGKDRNLEIDKYSILLYDRIVDKNKKLNKYRSQKYFEYSALVLHVLLLDLIFFPDVISKVVDMLSETELLYNEIFVNSYGWLKKCKQYMIPARDCFY